MQGASSVWSILNVFFADERFWLGDQMLWNSHVPRGTFSLAAAEARVESADLKIQRRRCFK
jgi:hypothetical protein